MPILRTHSHCLSLVLIAGVVVMASLGFPRAAVAVPTYTVTGTCGAWTAHADFRTTTYEKCPQLVARNQVGNFQTSQGSSARWTFTAPQGTTLEGATFKGSLAGGSSWRSRLFVTGNGWTNDLEQCSNADCYVPLFHSYGFTGHNRVVAVVTCVEQGGCVNGGSGPRGQVEISGSSILVGDPIVPNVAIVGGSISPSGWYGGTGTAALAGSDNAGIAAFDVLIDGDAKYGTDTPMPCDFNRPVPCADHSNVAVPIDLRGLPDGQHTLAGRSVDPAGNLGATGPITINVDNTAPQSPVAPKLVGRRRWRAKNAFSVVWNNRAEQFAPIAGAHFLACPQGEALTSPQCVAGSRDGTGITRIDGIQLPRPGTWRVRVWLYDAAGNTTSTNGVTVGGLGLIAGRKAPDGSKRRPTRLVAGGRRRGRRGGSKLTSRPHLKLGRRLTVRGRLTAGRGKRRRGLAGRRMLVYSRVKVQGAEYRRVGQIVTGKRGRYRYRAGAGPSRTLQIVYPGNGRLQGEISKVKVRVRARLRLGVDRHTVQNGESVALSGRLRGGRIPKAGALLELQVFSRDRWRPFATPRTDAMGRYLYSYRFETVTGVAKFRFRAVLRKQSVYPFTGASRPVKVRVEGL